MTGPRVTAPAGPTGEEERHGPVRALLPWALFAVTVSMLVASMVAAEALDGEVPTETAGFDGWLGYVWVASWVGFPLVGAILTSRRRTVLGWLLLAIGAAIATAIAGSGVLTYQAYVLEVTPHPVVLVTGNVAAAVAFGLAPFAFDRFPDDTPPVGMWRLVVRGSWVVLAVLLVALAIRPTVADADVTWDNSLALEALGDLPETVIVVGAVLLSAFFVCVVVRSVVRFRRSTGVTRAQLKWFVSSLAVFPAMFAVVFLGSGRLPQSVIDGIVAAAFFISLNGIAAAIGIAIFRYRLFEIDRVVSRTVSYLAISAVLLTVYLGGILVSQTVLGPLAGGSDLGVAMSTLAAAALFQPVRRRVQSLVDRRFNRARYDAQRTVDAFSSTVRDEVELAGVVADLRGVVTQAVAPASVTLLLTPGRAP